MHTRTHARTCKSAVLLFNRMTLAVCDCSARSVFALSLSLTFSLSYTLSLSISRSLARGHARASILTVSPMAKEIRDTFRRKAGSDTFRRKVLQGQSQAQTPGAMTPSHKGKAYEKVSCLPPPWLPSFGFIRLSGQLAPTHLGKPKNAILKFLKYPCARLPRHVTRQYRRSSPSTSPARKFSNPACSAVGSSA